MKPVMLQLIEKKKEGGTHELEELAWLCSEYLDGSIPAHQVAAWLMAVCWRGMTVAECLDLTHALVRSGQTLDWPPDRPVVDKHSTGGVGDKTSLVLVPLVAAAGVIFVKMSGRGLGHTGGTIDKLESIPGFRTDLTLERLREQVDRIGCALMRQSVQLAPADGALYTLRNATATVDSLPLIGASIMSKKIAAGARSIILDVKYGSGAFLPDEASAIALAEMMVRIGQGADRSVEAVLSPMGEPLGLTVGNALEVAEAIETLRGSGPTDLRELTLELGARLLVLSRCTPSLLDARRGLEQLLDSGVALDKMAQLIEAQGGDPRVLQDPKLLPRAAITSIYRSPTSGWLERVDARGVARVAFQLGAGRRDIDHPVNPATGIRLLAKGGAYLQVGQPLAEIHAASPAQATNAERQLAGAFHWSAAQPAPAPFQVTPLVIGPSS